LDAHFRRVKGQTGLAAGQYTPGFEEQSPDSGVAPAETESPAWGRGGAPRPDAGDWPGQL